MLFCLLLADSFLKKSLEEDSRFMFYSITTGVVYAPRFRDFNILGSSFQEAISQGNFWLDVTGSTET